MPGDFEGAHWIAWALSRPFLFVGMVGIGFVYFGSVGLFLWKGDLIKLFPITWALKFALISGGLLYGATGTTLLLTDLRYRAWVCRCEDRSVKNGEY